MTNYRWSRIKREFEETTKKRPDVEDRAVPKANGDSVEYWFVRVPCSAGMKYAYVNVYKNKDAAAATEAFDMLRTRGVHPDDEFESDFMARFFPTIDEAA